MKNILPGLLFIGFLMASCGPTQIVVSDNTPPSGPAPQPEVSYQSFYDELSPYGNWIDYPGYGYVWMPNADPGFKPYSSNGHWVYTDEGWTWASNYNWGWAAFHYGRWFYDDSYGWMWVPGNEWAPAWVSWRQNSDYYGWAPLGPRVSIESSYSGGYNPPNRYWNFVPHQYVNSPQINNYYVNETRNVTIINNTTVINNTTIINNRNNTRYAVGPDAGEVGRATGSNLRPVPLRASSRPGEQMNNNGLSIYRPRVNAAPQNNANAGNYQQNRSAPAPAHAEPLRNVRPLTQQNSNNINPRSNDNQNQNVNQPQTQPQTQPVRTQPVYQQQPQAQPQTQPVRTQPVYPQQPQAQPQTQPVRAQPVYQPQPQPQAQPARTQPAANPLQQQFNRNIRPAPVNQPAPSNQQPVNQRPFSAPAAPNNHPVASPQGQPKPATNPPAPVLNNVRSRRPPDPAPAEHEKPKTEPVRTRDAQ